MIFNEKKKVLIVESTLWRDRERCLLAYGDWISAFCEEMWICELLRCNFQKSWDLQLYNTDNPWSSRSPDGQHMKNL